MRIALLGTRGVPASYSGFETCVEQLGQRLVERGHDVTVYCRTHHIHYSGLTYKGMRLVRLPTIPNKYLDTIIHAFISSLHALAERYDVALYFIAGNSPATWIPRLVGTKTVLNVDGLDWKRRKWPLAAKLYIRAAEYLATRIPNAFITDSTSIQQYYAARYRRTPPYIPYGSEIDPEPAGEALARFDLSPRRYVLFVGRLVPENCPHHLVGAFRGLATEMKCVIVGDAPYAEKYKAELLALSRNDPRIIFTGYLFGTGYAELGSHAYVFVETSEVGGTHPAILEALALGNCVVVNGTAENRETLGEAGYLYDGNRGEKALREVLQHLLGSPEEVAAMRSRGRLRAKEAFSWEAVTDSYERLFFELAGRQPPDRIRRPA